MTLKPAESEHRNSEPEPLDAAVRPRSLRRGGAFRKLLWIGFVTTILTGVAGVYSVYTSSGPEPVWRTYTSAKHSLSFEYPADWKVSERGSTIRAEYQSEPGAQFVIDTETPISGDPLMADLSFFSGNFKAAAQQCSPSMKEHLSYFASEVKSPEVTYQSKHGCWSVSFSTTLPFLNPRYHATIVNGDVVYMPWYNVTAIVCEKSGLTVVSLVFTEQKGSNIRRRNPLQAHLEHMIRSISLAP